MLFLLCSFAPLDESHECMELYKSIRCPDCSGQNIYDSQSEFAKLLRAEIKSLLNSGYSKKQTILMLKQKYGEGIYTKPDSKHRILWLTPMILMVLMLIVFIYICTKKKLR